MKLRNRAAGIVINYKKKGPIMKVIKSKKTCLIKLGYCFGTKCDDCFYGYAYWSTSCANNKC